MDRILGELDTDYIDVVLMHCLTDEDWPSSYRGVIGCSRG